MTINDETLRTLLDFTDDLGVLSVLAGFAPDHAGKPTAPIAVRNLVKDLRAGIEDRDVAAALGERLDALGEDMGGLLAPGASGRGRALYIGLASGRTESVNIQLPFEERVVLRNRPFVRPLIAAIDEGRATGIVVCSQSGIRVLEWTIGATRELATMDFELGDAQLADTHRGPAGANPGLGQSSVSHREQFEDRVDSNRHRFLKEASGTVADFVRERAWDRLVLAGPQRVRDQLQDELTSTSAEILPTDQNWEQRSPGEIAKDAWPVVRSHHVERERALVEDVRDRSASGGAGALGPARVCRAVNQGQVAHLLFAHDAEVQGFRSPSMGTLHFEVGGAAAQADVELEPVEHLVEELVEKVLATGGRVTRVDDDDALSGLAAYHGIGARLRW